jgi:hypothetical protein
VPDNIAPDFCAERAESQDVALVFCAKKAVWQDGTLVFYAEMAERQDFASPENNYSNDHAEPGFSRTIVSYR